MPKLTYLRPWHKQAIEMKWQSARYEKIANEVGVTLDTVKSWFRSEGLLRKAYDQYAEDQILAQEKLERINTLKHTNNEKNKYT